MVLVSEILACKALLRFGFRLRLLNAITPIVSVLQSVQIRDVGHGGVLEVRRALVVIRIREKKRSKSDCTLCKST